MILSRISILNYRNLPSIDLELSPKLNCFIGNNGMGKTNFLDTVYYLSFCRSAYNPVDSQLIRHGESFFMIDAYYNNEMGETENIYCSVKKGVKKTIKRNKKTYKKISEHFGLIPLVFASPSDSEIINGSSDVRRHLMDMVISQYDNTYINALTKYNLALTQRNALLKLEEEPDLSLLELWEEEMAIHGIKVYGKRKEFIDEFIPVFQSIYEKISDGGENVSLNYISHCNKGELFNTIQAGRVKDKILGYSTHGIHRDDLEMLINEHAIKREGSQGQIKTYSLAIRLAQANFLNKVSKGNMPILLLDDIFDKLDKNRVERIVKLVSNKDYGQILITDTNREHLNKILEREEINNYKLFEVINGEICLKNEYNH